MLAAQYATAHFTEKSEQRDTSKVTGTIEGYRAKIGFSTRDPHTSVQMKEPSVEQRDLH